MKAKVKMIQGLVKEVFPEAEASGLPPPLRFDPPVPTSTMVHCYIEGKRHILDRIHDKVKEEEGIKLWNGFRGKGYDQGVGEWQYFEWSLGPGNMTINAKEVEAAWRTCVQLLWEYHHREAYSGGIVTPNSPVKTVGAGKSKKTQDLICGDF